MKIQRLKISGIGGIRELDLHFDPHFNAICGPNGIGKTTILKAINNAFAANTITLRRNAAYEAGNYKLSYIDINGANAEKDIHITEFDPTTPDYNSHIDVNTPYVMFFPDNRAIDYQSLNSIPRDAESNIYQIGNHMEHGIASSDIKGWFNNRHVFGGVIDSLSEEKRANIELAKRSFSTIDPNVSFHTINASSLDIMLTTRDGDVYFEYLSAGFKSCIYTILGLIKEIEYRFGGQQIKAEDFDGIILIDEIDLHLHPTWQAKLIDSLKTLFPQVQFITTTHSPSVLQSLSKNEIIPLTQDEEGNITVKELELTEFGLQGWTIEEILRDVMEMPETTSKLYETTKKAYDQAMNDGDDAEAKRQYDKLKQMLHPDSIVGKLLDIQMAGIGDDA